MMGHLIVHRAGPSMTLQDKGRVGQISFGLSRGGAVDLRALHEGAALLNQSADLAVLEMAGSGGVFEATRDIAIALSGADMRAKIDEGLIAWNASHFLAKGSRLEIGSAPLGRYGYLHVLGGFDAPSFLGSKASHVTAGIGGRICALDRLGFLSAEDIPPAKYLNVTDRFSGGEIRVVPSLQTHLFDGDTIRQFEQMSFHIKHSSNRMGIGLESSGPKITAQDALSQVSETVVPGDIQITGDGTPVVLLCECQTTGGYPRIGSVLPSDLNRLVQTGPKHPVSFRFIELEEAVKLELAEANDLARLHQNCRVSVVDPSDIDNLLSYQLIGGVTDGRDLG